MDLVHPRELRDRPVLVLGLGSFGGGAGCARALARAGARVTVTDLRPAEALAEARRLLAGEDVAWALGGHREEHFADAEWVVVNPAVPQDSPWLAVARAHGCRLTTDVNLALAACPRTPAFAVTGTHGKSTCAAFAAHLLEDLPGRTVLAGNLGGSLLERTAGLGSEDRLVVELSSFQTERLAAPPGWPRVAALTCLGADHLDRHGTREDYAAAKRRLLAAQDASGVALVPADDAEGDRWAAEARGSVRRLDAETLRELPLEAADLPFREPYRLTGLLAAATAALLLGADPAGLAARARSFPGLPHRMQRVALRDGRRVLDNGVATHPEPTAAALAHIEGPVLLLAGGKDKMLPLDGIVEAARRRGGVRMVLHGAGGARLAREAAAAGISARHLPRARHAMEEALRALGAHETLLFSPTFSSYDEFRNFEDRARLFRRLCEEGDATAECRDSGAGAP